MNRHLPIKIIRSSLLIFSIFIGLMGTIALLVLVFWGIPREDLRSQLPAILIWAGFVYGICAVALIIRHFLRNKVSSMQGDVSLVQDKLPKRKIIRSGLMFFAIMSILSGTLALFIIVLNFFTQGDLPDQPFMALVITIVTNYSLAVLLLLVRSKFIKNRVNKS
ncbi:hypothetical protein [Rossellomorea vietnamensis]|uniref:hypothetical protein n=1 Tax=Rossellomorea vietnamensis TaxID=218284 RepID=UPI003D26DF21